MGALFRAIQLDSLPLGAALFFPEAAYVAMKHGEIANPRSDYVDRLVGFLRLDISAYHAYLTSRGRATFDGINANPSQVTWIAPGECENSIGYWHFPGVRLVFTQHHVVRSFAVASLLSWHDVWYVVHLGPNPRLRNVGAVDAPLQGRGVAGPSGGC